MKSTEPRDRTRWHRLLGKMLEQLLTPVDVTVLTDVEDSPWNTNTPLSM